MPSEFGGRQPHQRLTGHDRIAIAHEHAVDARRVGGDERLLGQGTQHRGQRDRAVERQEAGDQREAGDGAGDPRPAAGEDLRAPRMPGAELGDDGTGEKHADLHGKQDDAERLEEFMIHEQRDADVERGAVGEGYQRVAEHEATQPRRQILGGRLAEREQRFAQAPAHHCEGAGRQIGHADQVGEDVIAVEAHERAGVDQEAGRDAGGGENEGGGAGRAVGQEGP